jgi:hypothetical protein
MYQERKPSKKEKPSWKDFTYNSISVTPFVPTSQAATRGI